MSPRDAAVAVRSFPRRYRALLAGLDLHGDDPDSPLRRRPPSPPGGGPAWSALEHTAHVADRLDHLGPAIRRVLVDDNPSLPSRDLEARAVDRAYNQMDKAEVLGWLDLVCADLATVIDGVSADDWRRTGRVDGRECDALTLVRDAVHEGSHHLRDVERVLAHVRTRRAGP